MRTCTDSRELAVANGSESLDQQRVVAELRMRVEREVVRGKRQVRSEERLEPALQAPVDHQRLVPPEQAVMHENELRTRCPGALEQLAGARHSAHELRHVVGTDDLQTRPAVLGESLDVEQIIRKRDD